MDWAERGKEQNKKMGQQNGTTKWIMELERIDADDGRKGDPPAHLFVLLMVNGFRYTFPSLSVLSLFKVVCSPKRKLQAHQPSQK